jgi:positive phototaxis protein PixI
MTLSIPSSNALANTSPSEQKFVSFQLGQTALLPLEYVTELFQINLADILPVPEMPFAVLGIYNWREEMLWMVDLNVLTGLPSVINDYKPLFYPMAMVLQIEGKFMGLVVREVNDIENMNLADLKPVSNGLFSSELLPFVQGYFNQSFCYYSICVVGTKFTTFLRK